MPSCDTRSQGRARAYEPPRLVRYGSIVDLTQAALSFQGPKDGAQFMIGWFTWYLKSL